MSKKGLGKGLGALLSEDVIKNVNNDDLNKVIEVDINKIEPDKLQPRKNFDIQSLEELAESIKSVGIISPIIVKKKNSFYQIISGERRWRASRIAGLSKIPVIVREYSDINKLQVSLIENLQRENLNPVEEASTYKTLYEDFNLSHEEIARKVGKSRSVITNSLRILKLEPQVQDLLINKKISTGHAKVLASLEQQNLQVQISQEIINKDLNVRQTENLIKNLNNSSKNEDIDPLERQKNHTYEQIKNELNQILGTKVNIKSSKNKGKIEIEYYSQDELDRLFYLLKNLK